MKFFKYSLVLLLAYFILSIIHNEVISPKVTLINNTDYDLRLYVTETDGSMSSDPTVEEVENTLSNAMRLRSKAKHSFSVSTDGIFFTENTALMISATNKDEESNLRVNYSPIFFIGNEGFCHYTVNIYENHTEYDTSKINICYKRFFLFE